jgi:hypothetical protein
VIEIKTSMNGMDAKLVIAATIMFFAHAWKRRSPD